MFEVYTVFILVIVTLGTAWGAYQRNDAFHPLVYLMPMMGYLYVLEPVTLLWGGELSDHFTDSELAYVQGYNLACVAAVAGGVLVGDKGLRRDASNVSRFALNLTPHRRRLLRRMAWVIGGLGFLVFVIGILYVGGFTEAFGTSKGGGWAPTGYLRDLKLLVIPGIVLLYMSQRGKPWSLTSSGLLVLFSIPLAARAFLATSRGWLFMGVIAVVGGWYLVRTRRPGLWTVLVGGVMVWILMLVLVTYRGQIYIGSDFFSGERPPVTEMVDKALDRVGQGGRGQTFVYGTYATLLAWEESDIYWGARYLAYTVIRPIPSRVWPTKYTDMGVSGIRYNAGTMGEERAGAIYESLPPGQYPGFAGDLFVEFAWGGVLAALLFGWLYGTVWRRRLVEGGLWTVVYLGLFAMSVFAVMQTLAAAFIARALIVSVPPALLWRFWMNGERRVRGRRKAPAAP
ncbi:hypothetical protein [Salinibacter ruber]|uniref:Oligosaccharide repeat unit polymerase n=1 Tax=Salinibacter ruber TaxID=146919 RepID=A0A9X2V7I6_9BACT|nr:hypothetical protein [Salinibacter ruber]MCS4122717.1 hypothetical protein [Salinibacter ruber]